MSGTAAGCRSPLPGLEAACVRVSPAGPWMAGGMGTDGSRLTPTIYLINQQPGSQSVPIVGLKNPRRSIKESETPHRACRLASSPEAY